MFCKNCGKEITNNIKFCPSCGKKVEDIVEVVLTDNEKKSLDKGPWKIFAIVGFICGILSVIPISWVSVPFIYGIVFSALGLKSTTKRKLAKTGLILSILPIAISIIGAIIYLLIYILGVIISLFIA